MTQNTAGSTAGDTFCHHSPSCECFKNISVSGFVPIERKRFEYEVFEFGGTAKLNELGALGWQLVHVTRGDIHVFMREVE